MFWVQLAGLVCVPLELVTGKLLCALGLLGSDGLVQWFSEGGDLAHPGTFGNLETFRAVIPWGRGGGCYWHVVGRGQGSC